MSLITSLFDTIEARFITITDMIKMRFITLTVLTIHAVTFFAIFQSDNQLLSDYIIVWGGGVLLSSVELGSRYRDEPSSVLISSPGILYLSVNGLISCLGLFCVLTFSLHIEVDDVLSLDAQRTMDIMQATLGSMFVMRSSFLKLGHDSKIDLGLSIVLKKLLDMIDREVDRVRAAKRSKDVTGILSHVSYSDTRNKVIPYCLEVMQNVSPEERRRLKFDLNAIDAQDEKVDRITRKFSVGLIIYNIVGKTVLEAAVNDLKLIGKNIPVEPENNTDPEREFGQYRDTYFEYGQEETDQDGEQTKPAQETPNSESNPK
ncbi:MAG: hypothetical protein V7735_05350 [Photobacterium frigidiphilum]|uniref:hypothetical protein n=1 Tax=Photobacterium frigidiphilum TaxID=264736 RepID=UPI0030026D00